MADPGTPAIAIEDDEAIDDMSDMDSTASIRSSILRYPIEHGRQYHAYKDGNYHRPNDDTELDRLDLMHEMISIILEGKLHLAPIGAHPQRCLDIGAGSGIWTIEFAEAYPSAEVIGVDLSPTFPNLVPPNCKFEIDDIEDEWTFSSPFDYIHSRYMAGSIKNWPGLMSQCLKNIRPGGWVEFQDFNIDYYSQDGSLTKDHALRRWLDYSYGAEEKTGRTLRPGAHLEIWAKEAGFINVHAIKVPLPLGTWPRDKTLKRIGAYNWTQLYEGLQGMSDRLFTKFLGWSELEMQLLLVDVRKDLRNTTIHPLFDFYTVCCQRPSTGT